jgi:cytochrome c oxidase subunit 2
MPDLLSLKNGARALRGGVLAAALAGASVALATPLAGNGYSLPRDASVDGWRIDHLLWSTSAFVILLFTIMVIWMLLAIFKFGEKHEAQYDHGSSKHSVTVALSISAVIFFTVDGNLFYNGMDDLSHAFWDFGFAEAQKDAVRIEVDGHQWAWNARYAGPDGKFNTADDIITLNDIKVPVGSPVILELVSNDVIHSFYLPNFRVKADAVPGQVNRMWFRAKETGEFDIGCAQHCGLNHYKMKALLTVLPRKDFDAWVTEASADNARGFDSQDTIAHWGWDWTWTKG